MGSKVIDTRFLPTRRNARLFARQALSAAVLALGLLSACVPPVLSDQTPAPETAAPVKEVQVLIPPIVEPGKLAWISVYEEGVFALSDYPVLINGQTYHTDSFGVLSFSVPEELKISLPKKGPESEMTFSRTPGGLLVSEAKLAPICDALRDIAGSRTTPTLMYAPASIDKSSPFMVFGKNLSGKFDGDRLKIDGLEADLFAGSSVCLLARGREQMPLGALRELCVFSNNECSESHEVDICRLQVSQQDESSAVVSLVGTNMPALVEVLNRDPAAADLQFKSKKLGTTSTVVLPGGDTNRVQIGFVPHGTGKAQFETRFLCDPLLSLAWQEKAMEDANVKEVCKLLHLHQAARMKRRLLSVDTRLMETQKRREQPTTEPQEAEQMLAEVRALSLRKEHLISALAAQRILLLSEGATDQEYDQAVDAATGGVAYSFDKKLDEHDLTGAAILARTDARRRKQQSIQSQEALLSAFVMPAMQVPPPGKWRRLPKVSPRYRNLIPPPPPYLPSVSELGPMVFIQEDMSALKHPTKSGAVKGTSKSAVKTQSSAPRRRSSSMTQSGSRRAGSSKRRSR